MLWSNRETGDRRPETEDLIVGDTRNTDLDVVYRTHGSALRAGWFEGRLVS
jgi:hypothetical protein